MMIKAKPLPFGLLAFFAKILIWIMTRRFKKIVVYPTNITDNSSFIFMSNHFSFLDGFIAGHILVTQLLKQKKLKGVYIMILDKQLKKNKWITRFGGFSVSPGTDTVDESIAYAASILDKPGNLLLLYPQGKIESNHVDYINVKNGIAAIVPQIKGNCQLLWTSNLVDYYEGVKPSLYSHMLDCGNNSEFDFEKLKQRINTHHQESLKKQIRFPQM